MPGLNISCHKKFVCKSLFFKKPCQETHDVPFASNYFSQNGMIRLQQHKITLTMPSKPTRYRFLAPLSQTT
jgi:hypothetical protein